MEEVNRSKDIRDYFRIVVKRRWLVITIFILVVLLAAVHAQRKAANATPEYRATARIVFQPVLNQVMSVQELIAQRYAAWNDFQTQMQIITSRAVANEVIRRLDLANSPEFGDTSEKKDDIVSSLERHLAYIFSFWKNKVFSLLTGDRQQPADEATEIASGSPFAGADVEKDSWIVSAVTSRIEVEWIERTRLVDISYTAKDPVMAARIANEIVQAFIELNMGAKLKATKDAIQWLSERMEMERAKVEASEIALLRYKEKHGIVSDFAQDSADINAEKLGQLGSQLVELESRRVEAETRYRQALELQNSPEMLDSIPEVLNNELIQEIKKMEVQLYNRMSELSKKYGKNHPQMVAITSELGDLQTRRNNEIKRIVNSLRNEYRLILAKEESLRKVIKEQESKNLELNKKAIQYRMLQHQAESSQQMYEMLLNRLKETSLTEEMKTGNVRVVDKAVVPKMPINPSHKAFMRNAVILALLLSIGAAFLLERIDNSFKHPDQVKEYLSIPYLGPISAYERRRGKLKANVDLVTLHSPKSVASESYRGIRTNILLSSADKVPQIIMVTSSGPMEGKTTCAVNLAVVMAQAGSRVLLIDGDMRRPRVHKVFDMGQDKGLSNVLTRAAKLEENIVATDVANLDVLTCGAVPPNPSEMLGSNRMKSLLGHLRKHYTRIIIDTPPVMRVTDAVVLSGAVDGVVVLIRAGDTPRDLVQNAVGHLQTVRAPILGAVLNGVKTGKGSYYYYQYAYYYYGEEGEEKKGRKKKRRSKEQA
jgi:capsular exopolysaccharide synthesis family protein